MKGRVFDIKKYAIDDGPGIRTTVFLKGCPLRCWWCHNPEGQASAPELLYRRMRCMGCGECAKSCERGAISFVRDHISVDRKCCNLCARCTQKCPTNALAVAGREMSVDELEVEIEKDHVFYDQSDGGVTFSGGEPLMQLDFLDALLKMCRARDVHTAVDTCGYAPRESFDMVRDKVNLFLYDIKHMVERTHTKYTGVSNKLIIDNLSRLAESGSEILVRFPVIPGINDGEDNVMKTAELMVSHGIKDISVLPYHRAGTEKYRSLNRRYRLRSVQAPSEESMGLIKEKLEAFGLRVKIGG